MTETPRTSIDIEATSERAFDHLVQPELLVRWMGHGCRHVRGRGTMTHVELEHTGLIPTGAAKHAIGWPHFLHWLGIATPGGDPGPDPWKATPPT
jgi:hypothetical protein